MADSENPNLTNPIELMALLDIEFEERTPTRVTAGPNATALEVEP